MLLAVVATAVLGGCSPDEGDGEADGPEEVVLPYGESSRQRVGLTRPEGTAEVPVVVLVHGGFWRSDVDRHAMDALVESVVDEGWAAWNVEHRPTDDGGGWPETFDDVAAAVDEVAEVADEHHLDPSRVVVLGHAGGGTLALWTGARAGLPAGAPGADPVVRPVAVASLAGIPHLVAGSEEQLASGAVDELMGGPPGYDDDDPYLLASPAERLPFDIPQLLVAGDADPVVPVPAEQRLRRPRRRGRRPGHLHRAPRHRPQRRDRHPQRGVGRRADLAPRAARRLTPVRGRPRPGHREVRKWHRGVPP